MQSSPPPPGNSDTLLGKFLHVLDVLDGASGDDHVELIGPEIVRCDNTVNTRSWANVKPSVFAVFENIPEGASVAVVGHDVGSDFGDGFWIPDVLQGEHSHGVVRFIVHLGSLSW